MPLSIKVKITGTDQELAKLKKLGDGFQDFSVAMKLIGDEVTKYYSGQVFASQGGIIGERWPALNANYAKSKAKRYPGRGILIATGTMQQSFKSLATAKKVLIYNTAPYFKYHQSTKARTKIPYRPMMKIDNDVKNIVRQIMNQDIQRKIEAA